MAVTWLSHQLHDHLVGIRMVDRFSLKFTSGGCLE
jgi:hypothetical protein